MLRGLKAHSKMAINQCHWTCCPTIAQEPSKVYAIYAYKIQTLLSAFRMGRAAEEFVSSCIILYTLRCGRPCPPACIVHSSIPSSFPIIGLDLGQVNLLLRTSTHRWAILYDLVAAATSREILSCLRRAESVKNTHLACLLEWVLELNYSTYSSKQTWLVTKFLEKILRDNAN